MMSSDTYFVLWPDGQKFGPADISTLQRWAVENRIGPATLLEESASGRHVRALDVPGLQSVLNLPFNAPHQAGAFVPANPSAGMTEVRIAWILGAVGLLGIFCCFGSAPALAGIVLAVIAMNKRQPNAVGALIFNIVVVVLGVGIVGLASLI